MKDFLNNYKLVRVAPDGTSGSTFVLSAGTTDVNSAAVDVFGYRSVAFVLALGAIVDTGTLGLKLQGSVDGTNNWTDITGAAYNSGTSADDNKLVGIEVSALSPSYRYARIVIDRGTANLTVDSLIAVLGAGADLPPVHDSATVEATVVV